MGDEHETRKVHMHPWIHRVSSEYESDTSDASDPGACEVFDRAKVQEWLEEIPTESYEDTSVPATAKRKRDDANTTQLADELLHHSDQDE